MKVLIIIAHPEPRSLIGSLYNVVHDELEQQGHEIQTSDLYRMRWKSQADRDDFDDLRTRTDARLKLTEASFSSYASGTLTEDVKQEQSKLLWADLVIFVFPIWWFSFPAILKGWFDRVFTKNFAYGTGDKTGTTVSGSRLEGKRAMVITTVGGKAPSYSARGIHGTIDEVLFPINHGVLHFTGFVVLPPVVVYDADRVDDADFDNLVVEMALSGRALLVLHYIANDCILESADAPELVHLWNELARISKESEQSKASGVKTPIDTMRLSIKESFDDVQARLIKDVQITRD